MKGAEILLHTLAAGGVDVCFANPGTSEMQFVAALDRVPAMRSVLTLFEGVATGAADGYARMADRPAATLLHLGPGLANGLANLHNARKAHTPMVNVVGEHATSHAGLEAPLTSDIQGFAAPASDWVRTVADVSAMGKDAADAVAAARTSPGKVATLIVPADASWNEGAGPAAAAPVPSPARVDEARVEAAAQALKAGDAMLFLGGRTLRTAALEVASRIAARCGARLMTPTFFARLERGAGRAAIERLPYFPEQALAALAGVRHLVLVDAAAPVSFFAYPGLPGRMTPEGAQIVPLAHPGEDGVDALERLADLLGVRHARPPRSARLPPELPTGVLDPESVGRAVAALLPEHSIVVEEAISAGPAAFAPMAAAAPHDLLTLTGGAIGDGLPMATGAAVASPGRRVVALQADGSGAYTMQALWTQARERLDVTTVLYANRQYRILHVEMARAGTRPGPRAESLLDLGRPELDWVRLAEGMGVEARRVTTLAAFIDTFREFTRRAGPNLIEVVL